MKVAEGKIKLNFKREKKQRIPVRYIIKKEAGKVIAVANVGKELFLDIVERRHPEFTLWANGSKVFVSRMYMHNTYRAVATLDPEDTWDERVGMRIAGKKLKDKLNAAMDRRIKFLSDYLHKVADHL